MPSTGWSLWLRKLFSPTTSSRRFRGIILRTEQLETRLVPAFTLASTLTVHAIPVAIGAGDFNGDGKTDLAVANEFGSDVSVYIGNGNGHFKAAKDHDVHIKPVALVVADVNGDGKPDIITANNVSNDISVLLGAGAGKFKKVINSPAGGYASGLAVADLNGDGKLDVIVTNGTYPGSVSVLLGNGNGTFGAPISYSTDADPVSVGLADLNGDGKLDIVTANFQGGGFGTGNISVLLGNGNGTFGSATNFAIGAHDVSLQLADFNGDGKIDLAVANDLVVGSVSVALGNGNGTFGTPMNPLGAGSYTTALQQGDVNGDGKVDLIATSSGDNTVKILLGNGNGTFQAANSVSTGTTPISVVVADLTGDGKPDLAVGNYTSNTVSILTNTYPGSFSPNIFLGSGGSPQSSSGGPFILLGNQAGTGRQNGFAEGWTQTLETYFIQDQQSLTGIYIGATS